LQYEEGDAWDKEKLEKTLQSLRELELFEHIHLHPENSSKPEQDKHVLLKLVEDDRFELRLRAGLLGISKNLTWRDAATYKAGGSLLYKNPLNRGGIISLHADLTRFERHMVASYRHPWIFHYPCKTTYKGYSNRYIQPIVIGSKDPLYVATQQGLVTGLHIKYKALTFGLNTGFEWQKTSLKSTAAAEAINFSPSLVDRYVPYFYVEPTVVLDYLNDKLTPTHGSFTVITLKGMFPTERALTFIKFLIEESVFTTPVPPITLGLRFRFGHVFNQRFNQITPPERFFLGGPNTLRGYDLDFAPPLGCFNDGGKFKFVPQGGKTMINANFEIRFPIYKYISGALFQDAGLLIGDDLVSSFFQCVANHGVAATGFGVRYNTPIGPLRFDLGVKWKKFKNSDSPVAWYVTLGNAF
jgi:outer membrane protein insertion porin family